MPIKSIQLGQAGVSNTTPSWVYIETNDTHAVVTTAGYLNGVASEYVNALQNNMMALVSTKTSQSIGVQPVLYILQVSVSSGVWSLVAPAVDVPVPFIVPGDIQAGLDGTAGKFISYPATLDKGNLIFAAVANTGNTSTTVSNAAMGQASVISIPDPGASTANFIISKSAGTQHITSGALQVDTGAITSGLSTGGFVGLIKAFPTTTTSGFIALQAAVNGSGNFGTTISNATTQAAAQVVTVPYSGASTANFLLDTGTAATATINKISTGATPVPLVDPGSCTISAAAGAANTATITIQLKDGSGTNIARIVPFKVYSSSAADGLTLQGAASTGYSVASGGLSLANGTAVTTQISCMSSATGGCVLSLLDTGKQTSYLVLVLNEGTKISAQLSAGSYG